MRQYKSDSSEQDGLTEQQFEDEGEDFMHQSLGDDDEVETKSRGRPAIQEKWTKVLSLSHDNVILPKLHVIAIDLQMVSFLPKVSNTSIYRKEEAAWKARFFSKDFIEQHPDPNMDEHQLSEKELKEYGILVTNIRRELEDEAEKQARGELLFHQS